ncbi:MAG: DMT family transporter [Clostridium argentinense]|uniref:DMT family transporter n=1 Tax=Clostridium faecium TaxID=2762223 RepID=A0ABR8YQL0_9CLOT|nr:MULTISPECIES: DMT family transporter [Clostridium]MBD8046518.1 DMT family transporter [Clostridium faecium]MBS5823009.1 DMT family transporter [Clostridium argentinense]MDU1349167.1 DMT family transporter [Clostridium argentinense]
MIYIILAMIGGGLTIISMIINAGLAKEIGVLRGTLINYIVGLSVISILMLFSKNTYGFNIGNFSNIPFYAFLGGLIGVIVVSASNIVIPKIPTMYTTLLIFIGQIFIGIIIDYLQLNTLSKGKIIGGLLILLGMLYNSKIDKKQLSNIN